MILTPVAYRLDSPRGSVQACLQKKQEVAAPRAEGGINGIGAVSCCSYVSYVRSNGTHDNVFGNSRIRVPFRVEGVEVRLACVHGELTALWNVLEDEGGLTFTILEMYIEMSPCRNCVQALTNLLPENQEVLYSFDWETQRHDWMAAAQALCAG